MPEALVFDLFGTLVFFDDSRVPFAELSGRRVPMTVPDLDRRLSSLLPEVTPLDFLRELKRAGQAIFEEKLKHGIEVTTEVRFERALSALGVDAATAGEEALAMAEVHMDTLARAVVCPPGRADLLARLSDGRRLALLSNFDHGPTARRVLDEAGLTRFFDAIVVSAEEGLRKPVPAIFARCCERLGVAPASCLFIGDTWTDDIEGATSAGLPALWVRKDGSDFAAPACGAVRDVDELPGWLERSPVSGPGAASR